jgi:hypothetical protein
MVENQKTNFVIEVRVSKINDRRYYSVYDASKRRLLLQTKYLKEVEVFTNGYGHRGTSQ